jgi:hypothetical protein
MTHARIGINAFTFYSEAEAARMSRCRFMNMDYRKLRQGRVQNSTSVYNWQRDLSCRYENTD